MSRLEKIWPEVWSNMSKILCKMTMKPNALPMPHLCLCLQKDFQQDVGHSSDLDQKRSGILLTTRKIIVKVQRTSGKASTTRSIDKDLY